MAELTRSELLILIEALHPTMLEKARATPDVVLPESVVLTKLHEAKDRFIRKKKQSRVEMKA